MPFVQRDWRGNIIGLYGCEQPHLTTEQLPDDHPDVQAFLAQHQFPPMKPLTLKDIQRIEEDAARIKKDNEALRASTFHFNQQFSYLEVALSALLQTALNRANTQIGYAIYYSPTGFETRAGIVENTVLQLALENKEIADLIDLWESISKHIDRSRRVRNAVAHGSIITFKARNRPHVRLAPPAFDVIRIGRKMANRQIPGLSWNDLREAAAKLSWLVERVDDVNRAIFAFYDGDPSLPQKFHALRDDLRKQGNR